MRLEINVSPEVTASGGANGKSERRNLSSRRGSTNPRVDRMADTSGVT